MKVDGYEVSEKVIAAALATVSQFRGRWFRMHDLRLALKDNGVPYGITDRLGDRILQRERKAGRVRRLNGGGWRVDGEG